MQSRIQNIAAIVPEALQAMLALGAAAQKGGVPAHTLELMHLRASQINGCSLCVDLHRQFAKRGGETEERLFSVAAWREAPYYTDAERAALALTEAATRLSDRPDPVPDEVWNEAAKYYNEAGLASPVIAIATINAWNRLNVTTRQIAGSAKI